MRESGLRERKKEQTRRLIAEKARELFVARGFEAVTVAEVAAAAEVSEATVFNYFGSKEDLFYGGLEAFEHELLDAVRERAPGESALAAFSRFVLQPRGMLAADDPELVERLAGTVEVIESSPALLARERQILDGFTDALAQLLAAETGADADDVEPWAAANAMIGVHRAVIRSSRRLILDGVRNPELSRRVREQAEAALSRLEAGLGDYVPRSAADD